MENKDCYLADIADVVCNEHGRGCFYCGHSGHCCSAGAGGAAVWPEGRFASSTGKFDKSADGGFGHRTRGLRFRSYHEPKSHGGGWVLA